MLIDGGRPKDMGVNLCSRPGNSVRVMSYEVHLGRIRGFGCASVKRLAFKPSIKIILSYTTQVKQVLLRCYVRELVMRKISYPN